MSKVIDPTEEVEIVQSFHITVRMRPNDKDEQGNPAPPKLEFRPEGPEITPDDVIMMCARGIEWAIASRALARAAAAQKRVQPATVIPVGGGRNKVLVQ